MSERRVTPIGREQPGVGVGVGVGAERSTNISIRVGATLMKSVSIFLTSGRKASGNTKRTQIFAGKSEPSRRRRRKMPDEGSGRNSAYIAKVIESLKRKTRFSK